MNGKEDVFFKDSTMQLITAYEAKDAEADRITRAQGIIEMLSRKVKPSEIVNGEARVGKKGSEYTNPHKYIPVEVFDLVADKIRASTKR